MLPSCVMGSSTTAERQPLASTVLLMLPSTLSTVSASALCNFRGSITHPTQSLCTLRRSRRRIQRNTRYQADATPYLGRSFTCWITSASPDALTVYQITLRDRETRTVLGYYNGAWTTDRHRAIALPKREVADDHAARMRDLCPRLWCSLRAWNSFQRRMLSLTRVTGRPNASQDIICAEHGTLDK